MVESQEQVWDEIAEPWFEFRTKPFPELVEFLKDKKGNILDLGCGTGRQFESVKGKIYGVDFSQKMLDLAKINAEKKGINVKLIKAQAHDLPFEDNFFDAVIFISVLPCIESEKDRKKSLQEIFRVMKSKSQMIISTWSREHKRIKKLGDNFIPWTKDNKKLMRYYYIYSKEEIEDLLAQIGFKIIKLKQDSNTLFVVEKP